MRAEGLRRKRNKKKKKSVGTMKMRMVPIGVWGGETEEWAAGNGPVLALPPVPLLPLIILFLVVVEGGEGMISSTTIKPHLLGAV